MRGVGWFLTSNEISLTSSQTKTVLALLAASNHRVTVKSFRFTFTGTLTGNTDPFEVAIRRLSSAGTMSSLSPVKANDNDSETFEFSGFENATAEPAYSDYLYRGYVHPQAKFTLRLPEHLWFPVLGGERIGMIVTPTASASCLFRMEGME